MRWEYVQRNLLPTTARHEVTAMTHEQYREIFRIIDEGLWTDICKHDADGLLEPFDKRLDAIRRSCEDAKKILSEYIDRSSERMLGMVTSEAFRRFPAPIEPPSQQMIADRLLSLLTTLVTQAENEASQAAE